MTKLYLDDSEPFNGPFESPDDLEEPLEIPEDAAVYDFEGACDFVSWDGLDDWYAVILEMADYGEAGEDVHDYIDNISIGVVDLRYLRNK